MKNVQDMYSLAPMQEFMLLHSVSSQASDVLFDQFCFVIEQPLNPDAYRAAWQRLLDRHSVLRTAFIWEKVKSPLQLVRSALDLPFEILDWTHLDQDEQDLQFRDRLAEEKANPFNLSKAPLLRLTLARPHPREVLFDLEQPPSAAGPMVPRDYSFGDRFPLSTGLR